MNFNSNFDGIDTSGLEKFINNVLSHSLSKVDGAMDSMDDSSLHDFIQDTINKTKGNYENRNYNQGSQYGQNNYSRNNINSSIDNNSWPQPEFISIHGYFIVRFRIPQNLNIENIESYTGKGQLNIKWYPGSGEQIIALPGNLIYFNTKAVLKDNILEFRFPVDNDISMKKVSIQNM